MTALHRARAATLTTMPSNKVTNRSTEPIGDDLSSPKRASRATKRTECASPKTPAGKRNKANDRQVSAPPDSPTSDADDDVAFLKVVVNSDSEPSSPTVEIKEEQIDDDQTLPDDLPLPPVKTLAEWDFVAMYPNVRRAWNASKENPMWLMQSHSRMKHAYEEIAAQMKKDPTLKDAVVPDYLFHEELFQFSSFFPQLEAQCMERYNVLLRHESMNMIIAAEDLRDSLRASQDDNLSPVQSAGQRSPPLPSITLVCEDNAPTSMALPTTVDPLPVMTTASTPVAVPTITGMQTTVIPPQTFLSTTPTSTPTPVPIAPVAPAPMSFASTQPTAVSVPTAPTVTIPMPTTAIPTFTSVAAVANVASVEAASAPFVPNLSPISTPATFVRGRNSLQAKVDEVSGALTKLAGFDIPDAQVSLLSVDQMQYLRTNFQIVAGVMQDSKMSESYDEAHSAGDWDAIVLLVRTAKNTLNNMLLSLNQHGAAPVNMATNAQIKYLKQLNYDENHAGNKKFSEMTAKEAGCMITGLKRSKKMTQEIA